MLTWTNKPRILGTDLSKRIYGLDILRAYAILVVLYVHTYDYLPYRAFDLLSYICFDGVLVFFVLSGFLIGRILIKTITDPNVNKMSLFKFWANRWMRTLPPYYLALIIVFALVYGFDLGLKPDFLGMKKQLSYFFFLQNLNWPHFGFYPETWSLSVEEWFYLTVPSIIFSMLFIFSMKPKSAILVSIIVVIVSVTLYRYYKYMHIDGNILAQCKNLHIFHSSEVTVRLDSLIYGILGSFIAYYYPTSWKRYRLQLFIIGIILALILRCSEFFITYTPFLNMMYNVFYYTITAVSIVFLLPYLSLLKKGSGIVYKALSYISLISYSLYLLHYTLIRYCIIEQLTAGIDIPYMNIVKFVLVWLLSFLLATIMYLYIEKPSMSLRNKIKFINKI